MQADESMHPAPDKGEKYYASAPQHSLGVKNLYRQV
jgi:hypothetical protein